MATRRKRVANDTCSAGEGFSGRGELHDNATSCVGENSTLIQLAVQVQRLAFLAVALNSIENFQKHQFGLRRWQGLDHLRKLGVFPVIWLLHNDFVRPVTYENHLPRFWSAWLKFSRFDSGSRTPLGQFCVITPQHNLALDLGHVRGIGDMEIHLSSRRRRPLQESYQETILARWPIDDDVFSEHRQRETRLWLPGWFWYVDRDGTIQEADIAGADDLNPNGILAWGKHVLVGQHRLKAYRATPVNLNGLDKQAPPQRGKGIEHGIHDTWLEFPKRGSQHAFTRGTGIHQAGHVVGNQIRIGAKCIGCQLAYIGHPRQTLVEIVVRISEGVAQIPPLPVSQKTVEHTATHDRIFAIGGSQSFVVSCVPYEVDGAANATLGMKDR